MCEVLLAIVGVLFVVALVMSRGRIMTHNYCDTCGWTEDEIYVTDDDLEGGLLQCKKCYYENEDRTA